jgi:outer membrane protein TolC
MKRNIYILGLALSLSIVNSQSSIVNGQSVYTLEQILDSALNNNISLRNAKRGVDAAEEQRKEAFTKYFPTVSGTGLWFHTNNGMAKMDMNLGEMMPQSLGMALAQSMPPEALADLANPMSMTMSKKGVMAGVTAIQPVFAGGQIINGNKLAKVGEEASKLQMQLSENEVTKTIETYFWQGVTLEEKMKTVLASQALLADICKDVTVAVEAGVAMRNDLLQVQLRQNEIESSKLKLENALNLVKMLIAQYCGLESTDFQFDYDTEVTSPLSQKQNHELALHNTAEYQLLEKQVQAAKLQQKMEVGKNLPTVGVGAGYNYHNMLDKGHSFGMVFATVSIPISDWWGGSHAIKRKKIETAKAQDQLNDNSELLIIRMQKAWNDVEESYQQLGIAERSVEQADENLRLNRDYYQAGISTMSDLLEAQLLQQQSYDKYTDAYADYQNKLLAYKQAIGE